MTRQQWRRRIGFAVRVVLGMLVALIGGAPPVLVLRIGSYLLVGAVVEALVQLLGPAAPRRKRSAFERIAHPQPPPPPAIPEDLERLRREAILAVQSAGGWHFRLRPVLRDVTTVLLEDRRRVALDTQPDAAREALGPAWDHVRPDTPSPDDRWSPGISPTDLDALVTRIEEL